MAGEGEIQIKTNNAIMLYNKRAMKTNTAGKW